MIERIFQTVPDGKLSESNQQTYLVSLGWSSGKAWDDLLRSQRVLMISEAGAGKTYECQTQANRLWAAGEPAFFVELAALATEDVRNLLDAGEEARLDAWLSSQSDIATFFLDSVDELKLTLGSLERALKRLKKCIGNQLNRARIVITTRPIPIDEQLIRDILPVPPAPSSETSEEKFAKIAMCDQQERRNTKNDNTAPEWRTVALMPLSDEQIVEFSRGQGVSNPELLLEDLQRRNAQDFARRPQDLIELCVDWREHNRIRSHRDQVASNVRVKLLPHDGRREPAELSSDKAIEGACRLALAMQVTRRLTIRHSAASDVVSDEVALDPATILSDWQPNERKALLERPLFGFASYGRVRFHHRSVTEYLASERLITLRRQGMPFNALKRILFAETKGKTIARPSKRPIAGWLALHENRVFELLRDHEPAVLLDEGDPESLTQKQRNQALSAFANRYGVGGWRGIQVPQIQVHRFATRELASDIDRIWKGGVENPDVREVLLDLIAEGHIEACADIAFDVAQDTEASERERIFALDALIALEDKRLSEFVAAIAAGDDCWPDSIAERAMIRLFPKHASVGELCQTLQWIKQANSNVSGLTWHLARTIQTSKHGIITLELLRDSLLNLVQKGLKWRHYLPHITCNQPHLSSVLAAVCERGLKFDQSDKWLHAGALALRLNHSNYGDGEPNNSLRKRLASLNADGTARLFWIEDALLQSLHELTDPRERFAAIKVHDQPIHLNSDRDLTWVCNTLGDNTCDVSKRAVLLEAAIRLSPNREIWKKHVEGLRPLVSDEPSFLHRIDEALKPSRYEKDERRMERQQAQLKKKEERRKAKAYASWVLFCREVANQPEDAFSSKKSKITAFNLWRAMSHGVDNIWSSGWNRRFIEELFNKETVDRLRRVLMKIWRDEHPTLPSERSEGEHNTHFSRWQLGLAAIYAEAEDPDWATKLSDQEALLAIRYALIKLNGLPQWIEALAEAYPSAVDQTLGNELSWELGQEPAAHGHSMMLQRIGYTSETVARLFIPRLEIWLETGEDQVLGANNTDGMTGRVRQVTREILKHDDGTAFERLKQVAVQRLELELPIELHQVWLSTLMRIAPLVGIEKLEKQIKTVEPAERSEAVSWFAILFGDRQDAIGLSDERFTPQMLLRLLRLAYRHVRIQDDASHEGSYTADTRDNAEWARNNIVTALFNAKGEEGLAAKLEMAADPLFVYFKDRILAMAEENWAQEIDVDAFDETQAVALDHSGEAPAKTNEAMFAIMKDRLSDLDDLLLRDISPRQLWADISTEKIMRREIARELHHLRNSIYTVDQEAVTADEKETDIRLRSVASPHEAVIELKLGDTRSARDLRDTIENQLVKKYMAAESSRSGALLVTLSKDRNWEHPDDGRKIEAEELISLLCDESDRVQEKLGGSVALTVHFLDLRPRLSVEKPK
ncbi:hypothetical protein [Pseudovibrio sp. Tun.PSC04-5.I4]|uniref:NACHT domain-containing protein n=1 Tax=Pseudovibrio sp. Tun.PSC04-5.I4 TaxID=1798213 RepID=UPI00088ECFE9|nr:hypothetical protein [Pseudovibrio sp. Tun.PSC04-5.I4]SDR00213.1 hypothetical protein SAMN04515695_2257 [Pseudovibrio sp. Tun.PSC04-5.I4]